MIGVCCDPRSSLRSPDWHGVLYDPKRDRFPRALNLKLRVVIVALLGLALAVYLVMYAGIGAVLSAVGTVGWGGFGLLCLYALGLFIILGSAWYVLLPRSSPPGVRGFILARMVRDARRAVMPFSPLGGHLRRSR